jgi:multidrug efflux pump subunit AcrB
LSHYFLRHRESKENHGEENTGLMGRLVRVYDRALRGALTHSVVFLATVMVLIGASYFCFRALGTDLLPAMDEGGFILDYIMPAGSSLAETNHTISEVEATLRGIPEVENTSRRTGLQLGLAQVTEANTGDLTVRLKRNRKRSSEEVIADVRAKLAEDMPMLQV